MTPTSATLFDSLLMIGDRRACVTYDPDRNMLRGEFVDLNGGADFYGSDVATLKIEGAKSLAAFLDVCRDNGIEPLHRAH